MRATVFNKKLQRCSFIIVQFMIQFKLFEKFFSFAYFKTCNFTLISTERIILNFKFLIDSVFSSLETMSLFPFLASSAMHQIPSLKNKK
ncbi:hypothetical protein BpHYR1_015482 [Brachionus plicatilis]|uniref:Uncharacterized protein n=1 Tax=Brachionus plicatilis TaxID=10195 RepID=A0A3M7T0H4_BRAPC|nr:hypothetical protein BpHYR1_015482 [Brachionus plicatilis]